MVEPLHRWIEDYTIFKNISIKEQEDFTSILNETLENE